MNPILSYFLMFSGLAIFFFGLEGRFCHIENTMLTVEKGYCVETTTVTGEDGEKLKLENDNSIVNFLILKKEEGAKGK